MLINALALANDKQRAILNKWLDMANPDPQEKIAAVTEIYNEIGINELATEKIRFYFNESLKYLDVVELDDNRKAEMLAYTREMMKREY